MLKTIVIMVDEVSRSLRMRLKWLEGGVRPVKGHVNQTEHGSQNEQSSQESSCISQTL